MKGAHVLIQWQCIKGSFKWAANSKLTSIIYHGASLDKFAYDDEDLMSSFPVCKKDFNRKFDQKTKKKKKKNKKKKIKRKRKR